MRVDVLETLCELVVETVDEADHAAANPDNAILLRFRRALCKLIVVFRNLLDRVLGFLCNDGDELVHLALRCHPKLHRHVCCDGGIVVKAGGDQGKKDAYPLVRSDRHLQELLQYANLL